MDHALPRPRARFESALAITLAAAAGLMVVLLGGVAMRYHIAALLAALGIGVLCVLPDRRAICLALWVLIQPLGVETVFYVAAPVHPLFLPMSIVINAADAALALLLLFLCVESLLVPGKVWRWSRPAQIWTVFLLWAVVSSLIHRQWLQSGSGGAAPLELLRYVRLLLLAVIVQSAIRTRADLIAVLCALLFIVFAESILVVLSYTTGELFNFARLAAADPTTTLQQFPGGGGDSIARATGTVGHTNEQAQFHTFFTLPLIALLAARNSRVRWLAMAAICASGVAILLTFSRSAWLAFPLALIAAFVLALRRGLMTRKAWLVGGVLAIGAAIVLGALAPKIVERITRGDDGATASRLRMINLASDLFASSPVLGVGPGEYAQAALSLYPPEYRRTEWRPSDQAPVGSVFGRLDVVEYIPPNMPPIVQPAQVHNKYLLVLAELGVPGLLIFLWMYKAYWREAWACSLSRDPLLRLLGIGGVAAIVATLLYMGFDLFMDDKSMELLLFVPMLVTAAARVSRESEAVLAMGASVGR